MRLFVVVLIVLTALTACTAARQDLAIERQINDAHWSATAETVPQYVVRDVPKPGEWQIRERRQWTTKTGYLNIEYVLLDMAPPFGPEEDKHCLAIIANLVRSMDAPEATLKAEKFTVSPCSWSARFKRPVNKKLVPVRTLVTTAEREVWVLQAASSKDITEWDLIFNTFRPKPATTTKETPGVKKDLVRFWKNLW